MVLAFLTVFSQVVGTALQVAQAFHRSSSTTVIGKGGGSGFLNYYSHSSFDQSNIAVDDFPNSVYELTEHMCNDNPHMWGIFHQVKEDFLDLVEFRQNEADDENQKMYHVVPYENQHHQVFMYIWLVHPPKLSSYRKGEKVYYNRVNHIKVKINVKYSLPYMITSKVKSNFMSTTTKVGIQYLPDPG